ncbi:MAG: glycosyltransferase family 2 protein [Rhodocyclaceae bacterium]
MSERAATSEVSEAQRAHYPPVCICIPAFNAAKTIRETLASALAQTYPNFRIVVLDNASTDGTRDIVRSFADPRISLVQQESNIGAVANFDLCIQVADGTYTEIFHADEVYAPDMVAKQVAAMEAHPEAGVVFTEGNLIDSESRVFGETSVAKFIGAESGSVAIRQYEALVPALYRAGNFLLCSGALVRTAIYKDLVQRWRADIFASSCDLDVWMRIAEKHPVLFILEKLMSTRTSLTQASYLEIKRNTNRADMFLVLDHYLEDSRTRAALTPEDLAGYEAMQRMDRARRAMNLYMLGKSAEASAVLDDNLVLSLLTYAWRSRRGLMTCLLTVYLKGAILSRADRLGRAVMRYVERRMSA